MRGLPLTRAPGRAPMPSRGVGAAAPSTLCSGLFLGRRRPRRARRGVGRFPLLSVSSRQWGRGSLAFATASSRAALSAGVPAGSEGDAAAASLHQFACKGSLRRHGRTPAKNR